MKFSPFVSVIIPVYNDSKRLKICLKALEDQTYPKNKYEVIVVDNGSKEDIRKVTNKFSNVIVTSERIHGPGPARNKGISIAKGDVLAFTDSDCIPSQNWLKRGVKKTQLISNCGLIAGKIELFFKNPKKLTVIELFEKTTAFPQKDYIEKYKFGAMANVFTLKDVIKKVGKISIYGDDFEWGPRVFANGYKLIYGKNIIVKHPARHSFRQLYKKHRRVIQGLHDVQKKKGYPLKKFIIDLKDDWPHFKNFIKIFSDKRLNNYREKIKVFFVMLFIKNVRIFERIRLYLGGKLIRW